jgi:coenzyme F420 hydrogenase subunit delta
MCEKVRDDYMPAYYNKSMVVFGCGNPLIGDDGFGPKVIQYYKEHFDIPEPVCLMNVETSIRKVLFNIMISDIKPTHIVVIDAIDAGRQPGELFTINIEDFPENKIDDFSMHQLPTSNLLKELRDFCNIKITILSAQVENIPDEVRPGLSTVMEQTIPFMCEKLSELIIAEYN